MSPSGETPAVGRSTAARRDEELPVIRAFYDFAVWLVPLVGKFPRQHRFVLGERIERQLYGVLENLVRAKYARDRSGLFQDINLQLEILRFQLRLAKDLACLSLKHYGHAAESLLGIGKQLGGWQKHDETRGPFSGRPR